MCNIREFEPTSCREMLSPHWEVEEQALARAILRFATARELRQRVTAPDPWALKARQRAFSLVSRRLLQSRRPPSALVVTIEDAPDRLPVASPGAGRHRGSIDARYCEDEEDEAPKLMCFVREGLRQNGYEVRQVSGETAEDEDGAGEGPELVVLIGSNTNATAVHSRSNAGVERWFGRLRSRVADGVMVWWDGSSGEEMALTGQACADALAQGVDVCVSENADVGAPWRLGAKESRGLSPGDMRCWSLLLSIPRSRRRPAAAVGELLALVSVSARAEMSAVCRIEHARARLLAFYTTAGRILEKAGMVEAAAEHYLLCTAVLDKHGGRQHEHELLLGSMLARASVLLLRACQPVLAARAAVAALLLRPRHGRHGRMPGGRSLEWVVDRVAADSIAKVGILEAYAEFEDEENDDAIHDSALRLLRRVQGPTCAAVVGDICGPDRRHRSRLPRALAACLAWFYRDQQEPVVDTVPGPEADWEG